MGAFGSGRHAPDLDYRFEGSRQYLAGGIRWRQTGGIAVWFSGTRKRSDADSLSHAGSALVVPGSRSGLQIEVNAKRPSTGHGHSPDDLDLRSAAKQERTSEFHKVGCRFANVQNRF